MNAIVPGTTRYRRSLGFVGATAAEKSRNVFERATGLDFSGTLVPSGGDGITVGAAPSTIAAMILGCALFVTMGDKLGIEKGRGAFWNGLIGAGVGGLTAVTIRGASKIGF